MLSYGSRRESVGVCVCVCVCVFFEGGGGGAICEYWFNHIH